MGIWQQLGHENILTSDGNPQGCSTISPCMGMGSLNTFIEGNDYVDRVDIVSLQEENTAGCWVELLRYPR